MAHCAWRCNYKKRETVKIELSSRTHLRISWPIYDAPLDDRAIDAEIRRRLATVPGIEAGHGRVAWAPVIQLARLIELFPKSSIGYEAWREFDGVAQRFHGMFDTLHLDLEIDASGAVCAVSGENVSPLIEQLVSERSHALKPFVVEAMKRPVSPVRREVQPVAMVQYPKRRRAKSQRKKTTV